RPLGERHDGGAGEQEERDQEVAPLGHRVRELRPVELVGREHEALDDERPLDDTAGDELAQDDGPVGGREDHRPDTERGGQHRDDDDDGKHRVILRVLRRGAVPEVPRRRRRPATDSIGGVTELTLTTKNVARIQADAVVVAVGRRGEEAVLVPGAPLPSGAASALGKLLPALGVSGKADEVVRVAAGKELAADVVRSEEHTSELQSRENLVCRLLLEKKTSNLIL